MDSPSERFLSNTGGADVSIRTLRSHLSNRRNPRPRRQKISQATGIGNSTIIIDAEVGSGNSCLRRTRVIDCCNDCDSPIHAG